MAATLPYDCCLVLLFLLSGDWLETKAMVRRSGIEGASSDSDDEEDDSDEQDSEMSDRSPGRSPITGRQLSGISGRNAWLPKRFF